MASPLFLRRPFGNIHPRFPLSAGGGGGLPRFGGGGLGRVGGGSADHHGCRGLFTKVVYETAIGRKYSRAHVWAIRTAVATLSVANLKAWETWRGEISDMRTYLQVKMKTLETLEETLRRRERREKRREREIESKKELQVMPS